MNQLDWEKMKEGITIVDVEPIREIWSYNPSAYALKGSTSWLSGNTLNLMSDDGVYMTFRSYDSSHTGTTTYLHQEQTNIGGTNYRQFKTTTADGAGTSLSGSMGSTGRTLFDKTVYPLTGITSVPASVWNLYYRAWKDADQSITYDNASSTETVGATSLSWTHTTGSGNNRLLLVTVSTYNDTGTPATVTSATCSGVPMTQQVTNVSTTNPHVSSYIFSLANPTSGSNTILANFSGSTTAVGGAVSYSGVDQTRPIQTSNSTVGSGTSQSVSVTVTGNGRAIYGSLATYRSTSPTSYTITDDISQNHRWGLADQLYKGDGDDKLNVSPGSVSMSWTTSRAASYVCLAVAVNPATPSAGHCDVDILIRRSDGIVRSTVATNVGTSGSITTTASTLSGTYSWASYNVQNQTDYLEVDYYVDVSTACQGTNAYLRIDDSTLATADQTRIENVQLPSEYTVEVEFAGSSNTEDWNQANWTVNSAWTTSSVNVTLQLYNYTLDGFPTSGNGYVAYTSNSTANTNENKTQMMNVDPIDFRNATGYWKIKIKGVKTIATQFDFKADWIEFRVLKDGGTLFTFENGSPLTSHLVSIWVINSTNHQRHEIDIFINSGDTISYINDNISLPDKPYKVKVVTERGNIGCS
jgi:hypothetical protein